MRFLRTLFLFLSFLFIVSCKKEGIQIETNDFHFLVDEVTEVMIHDIFSPPVASRIYAYPNIAAYEVLNSENGKYQSLSHQLNDLTAVESLPKNEQTNKRLAALIAYLDVAKELVFSKEELISVRDSLYEHWKSINSTEFLAAEKYGLAVSSHIIDWMKKDNYTETRSMPNFNVHSDDPGRWQPTPPAYMNGIEPHWSKIRPFVLESSSQFKPVPPPTFSMEKNSEFYKEVMDLYEMTNKIREKGDASEEVAIAQFWDCNPYVSVNKGHFMFASKKITPGAHWIGICKIATKESASDFEKTIFAYTKTSIAIFDAFISCWDEKYRSNLIRPETLINKLIDNTWTPLLQTPPFPEYTSGHSVVSGAASEVLTSIFGDDVAFEDTTEIPYGLPVRNFTSFRNAAKEAAISRMYGGIHYSSAIKNGLTQGISLGNFVNGKLVFEK
ncbi:vanadium-dependent haloperoxidase [Polaribacter sp. BAL334]|uniref:vanadium-dependent haloperoxidase n=1 Tax=Polaribacter sp. BAL334 TaxID=1708178 RepID=UPI0018D1FE0E|nr:vanadium-dependent haloperoxidase [Polaribacter sp. BAL334]MBG7611892.1 vanadium-dependent haloperoxidase [Polaribacter sp. BAL334]